MKNFKFFAGILLLSLILGFLFVMPTVSAYANNTLISTNVTNGTWYKAGTNLSVNFTFLFTVFNTTENVNSINFTSLNYTFWNVTSNATGLFCGANSTVGGPGNQLNCTYNGVSNSVNLTLNITLNTTNNGNDYANGTVRTITINWTTNGSTGLVNSTTWNFSLDGTVPTVSMPSYSNGTQTYGANGTIRKNTQDLHLNISLVDTGSGNATAYCIADVNGTNQTFALSGAWCNTTGGYLGSLADGNRTIKIYVNDSVGNLNMTNVSIHNYVVMVDTTAPSATASCSPKTVVSGNSPTCTCTGTDATSGVSNSSATATPSTPNTGTFTYTCTVFDKAVNTGDHSATYTVETSAAVSSSSSSGGGSSGAVTSSKTSYVEATPAAAAIVKNFDENIGVKEIQISVNNAAQNIQVDVKKYDGKPANVSVEKTEKVYQYIQIDVKNLAGKLDKATVQFKVEKNWVTQNNLTKENVVVSKFNETSKEWKELGTIYSSEDNKFYYYNVELTSFSYFAISSRATTAATTEEQKSSGVIGDLTATAKRSNMKWIWIVVAVAVVVAIALTMRRKK